uniref:Protein spinster n=1 Tax=Lygus hesperus TaxID=30085 RepID=A0A146M1V6_LYGHE
MPAQKYVDKYTLKTLNMEPSAGIVPNNSQQHLMDTIDAVPSLNPIEEPKPHSDRVTWKEWSTVIILCFVNLINYMDRYTVAGVLDEIRREFNADFQMGGLLQTAFVLSYMIFAPLFGYMGDRYNRRYLMAFGVFFWSLTTLVGSFMPSYSTFLLFRSLVGIGEASYSTIAPTIISDIFVSDNRSKMLALFYFAIPVGSGMGYIVGSTAASLGDNWRWGLRVTPILGAVAVILIIFVLVDPTRGEAEGKSDIQATSYREDIKSLATNKSFMLSTFGFTCVSFVTGALAWWGPNYIAKGEQLIRKTDFTQDTAIALVFGVIAMMSGVIGVPLGSIFATRLRSTYPKIDPILCSIGLFISAPFIFIALCVANSNTMVVFLLVFFGEVALNLNWAIVADILLYVVVPPRRSTAEAFQILISHALGDAGSPYLVGLISDLLKSTLHRDDEHTHNDASVDALIEFKSLQYALFSTCFIEILGAVCFLFTSFYIVDDKAKAEAEMQSEGGPPTHMYADDPRLNCSEANLTTS